MKTLPGIEWHPVCYKDDEVFIRRAPEAVTVYHYTSYKTPLRGTPTQDWLCSGTWSIKDGKYYQRDGIGRWTGVVANNLSEIAEYIK